MVGDFKDIGFKDFVINKLTKNYEKKEFWAINDISFSLEQGDFLGIIGTNGAGKSTLLKAVSGIMQAQKGSCKINGNIAALLELGTGFDKDMNLRENIYLRGALLGYTEEFIEKMSDEILEFSELKKFENRKFGQLSSGMKARLAFSISCLVEPDILILDEVLSVGDASFRAKSEKKLFEIINGGATTILVSHSLGQVKRLCNKVLWLHKGRQIAFGETAEVCAMYERFLNTGKIETNIHKPAEEEKIIIPAYETARYNVGLVTRFQNSYYSLLANYALYKAVESLDMSVVVLDNIIEIENDMAQNFAVDNMKLATVIGLGENADKMNSYFDSFMLGVCNGWEVHNSYNIKNYTSTHLAFADIEKKKIIAYGIGYDTDNFTFARPVTKVNYSLMKQRFDSIGVCEDYAVSELGDAFGIECELVADPLLLLDYKYYHELAVRSTCNESEKYLMVYMKNYTDKYRDYINWAAETLNLRIIAVIDQNSKIETKKQLKNFDNFVQRIDIFDWLYYVENSSFIITDDFCCTCLAVVYHKNFVVFKTDDMRKTELLGSQLGFSDRILDETSENPESISDIDYSEIECRIIECADAGYRFINKAVNSPRSEEESERIAEADKTWRALKSLSSSKSKYKTIKKEIGYIEEVNTEIKRIQKKSKCIYLDAVYKYNQIDKDTSQFTEFEYITNAEKYFPAMDKSRYIILMSARGETGKFADKFFNATGCMNVKGNNSKKNCIVVIDSGNIVFEKYEQNKIMYNYNLEDAGFYAHIDSSSKENSSYSNIFINNINYSMNMNGINAAVYDKERKCVVDMFNVDTANDKFLYLNRQK